MERNATPLHDNPNVEEREQKTQSTHTKHSELAINTSRSEEEEER